MTTTIFDSLSHADFLRLTLQAFSKQGYTVEQSRSVDADGVLLGQNGVRTAVLCKKYRGAFIGRPVLQQFYAAMRALKCKEGYLVTTTDCLPDACEFAAGKGIVLYNRERTTELLRKAFGDEFIRSGKTPELGRTSRPVAPAARPAVSVASYEKVAASGSKAPVPARPPDPVMAPAVARAAEPMPAPMVERTPETEPIPASAAMPAPETLPAPEPVSAPVMEQATEPARAPQENVVLEDQPEEVEEVQELLEVPELQDVPAPKEAPELQDAPDPGTPGEAEAAPSGKTTIIVCHECNKQLQVPIDQGMITVNCPECGMRRIYQPELDDSGELKTTAVISCTNCKQKLNVPTNRGQLNVRCPQCKAAWVFTP